ncbi:hypothetical protein [Nocardioides stalactiti]|uniref:hypothetical protein n=1 Tax=Nocardioides stalactiti TaxID=2755356 RepID=UPI0016015E1B|nr:hypothetical protein [Nocardioides stalactiti]
MTMSDTRPTSAETAAQTRADYLITRIGLLLVVLYVVPGLLGFAVFAGFWPPPGPDLTAQQIADYFVEHQTGLTIGMVLMAFCGPWYVVWSAAISRVIERIEGPMGILAHVQFIGGVLTGLVTFTPATIWITAAIRAEDHSPETIQTLYDFGWMFFDTTFVCSAIQSIAIGVAVLIDRRATPLFPRWFAWMSFLTAACYVPLMLMPFFRTGPVAWDGAVSFWVVFVEFFAFTAVATVLTWRALKRLESEDLLEAAAG